MYKKGLIKCIDPPCSTYVIDEDGFTDCEDDLDHVHSIRDARADKEDLKRWISPCAYLPHSCDEWVIGGPEAIREMIADLQEVLRIMESN